MKHLKIFESFALSKRTQDACDFIINKLNNELDDTLYYHNLQHTLGIMKSVKILCDMENIDEETSNLLYVAAAYHDSGFLVIYDNNEPEGGKIASTTLSKFGFNDDEISTIYRYIMATQHTYVPKDIPEMIMKDADLSYLGTSDQVRQSDELRKEWAKRDKVYSDEEWRKLQIGFLSSHKYYTDSAKRLWDKTKQDNIKNL